jgi:hypothetical protein
MLVIASTYVIRHFGYESEVMSAMRTCFRETVSCRDELEDSRFTAFTGTFPAAALACR